MRLFKYLYLKLKRKLLQCIKKDNKSVDLSIIKRLDKVIVMGDNFPSVALSHLLENKTLRGAHHDKKIYR